MVKETKTSAEYKTPKCRVVGIHVQNLVCASPFDTVDHTEIMDIDEDGDL